MGGWREDLEYYAAFWWKWEGFCGRFFYQKHVKFNSGTIIAFGWFHQSLTFSRYLQQNLWKSIEHHFIWEKLSNIVWNRDPVKEGETMLSFGELGQRERGKKVRMLFWPCSRKAKPEDKTWKPLDASFQNKLSLKSNSDPGQELDAKVEDYEDRLLNKSIAMERCLTPIISDTLVIGMGGATCIGCKFDHLVAPLALVTNYVISRHHLHCYIVKDCSIGAITWYWVSIFIDQSHKLSAMHELTWGTLDPTPGFNTWVW